MTRFGVFVAALLALFVSVACGQGAGESLVGASALSDGTGRASTLAVAPPFSTFPGTGVNPGAGAPNSCPSDRPVVLHVDSVKDFIKVTTTKIDGSTRGYEWRFTRADADKSPFVRTFTTSIDDGLEGREVRVRPAQLDAGPFDVEVRARFLACRPDVGTWSAPRRFTVWGR